MSGPYDPAPICDLEAGCITCGDEAVAMRVERLDADRGLALCADAAGRRSSVETALVVPVAVGDVLLVHAGTAIARSDGAPDRVRDEPPATGGGGAVAR
jgi:hydrogenase maturation factor